ncbi:flagellar hook-associated protein FlgK [Microvirga tunisiensis]|uniref:Flagellar hook-associated protein FlgK n=2 Tax=Pannonibacter tanglangensis TaxID=2750084 RepID=A0ABW9ZJ14_9HYPH|nr:MULTISPECIES: flagellar hook-associated protein FlgK [unclassified Pannonibacter]NBN64864.1 flagellar hook-associated protein FlgK [Pannonibacter sp. XCT-34]NBN79367.1 flagellar hook-associated protein FlgK [Pannonibacter sp. XCT-53]
MSLSVALKVAQSALAARQTETATTSRNITGAQEAGYSRKTVMLSTVVNEGGHPGGVRVDGIRRSTDSALYASLLRSTARATSQDAVAAGLSRLEQTVGDTQLKRSPAAQLGTLETAIQNYASDPGNAILAQTMLGAAKDTVRLLNEYTGIVQGIRAGADADINTSVGRINELLGQVERLNGVIVRGTQSGADVTDALDARDKALLSLSEEIGISTLAQPDGGVVVYTDSGVTLFETTARAVSFAPTNTYNATTTGNAIFVDGVAVTGPNAIMPIGSGRLHGLTELRDQTAVTYQSQLDEVARGLIEAFAEKDQSGGGGPDLAGLFTYSGGPALPATATLSKGLAGDIRINANADPDQGGSLERLRDGGISDPLNPDYDYNPANNAGFSSRIQDYAAAMNAARVFDAGVGLDPTDTLKGFAGSSVSWLQAARKSSAADVEVQSVIVTRTADALSNATGVNLDQEMTLLLDIERAYGAAAKLISAVDRMLDDLLSAAR